MTEDTNDTGQDVFDDSEAGSTSAADEASITTAEGKGVDLDEGQSDDQSQSGENDAAPPAENQDDLGAVTNDKGQKMIPEHRFKAALKSVKDELDEARNELKTYKTPVVQVPDKDIDPDGHDLHIRMEASTSVMREMREDYQEVINHFAEMAKDNDLLNQAVAKHPLPAKLAYDIAKKDLEIKEALAVKGSDEWKQFQEWKKSQSTQTPENKQETNLTNVVNRGLKVVPNLNRSTNASPNRNVRQNSNGYSDDDLFAGAL